MTVFCMKYNLKIKILILALVLFFGIGYYQTASAQTSNDGCCLCTEPVNSGVTKFTAVKSNRTDCENPVNRPSYIKCVFKPGLLPDVPTSSAVACVDPSKAKLEICFWNFAHASCKDFTTGPKSVDSNDSKCSQPKPNRAQTCCCFIGFDSDLSKYNNALPAVAPPIVSVLDFSKMYKYKNPFNPLAYANYNPAKVIEKVLSTILLILGSIALIMFVWGGFTWMTAFGNESKVETAGKILIWSTVGLFVIFLSYILVGFLLEAFTGL